MPRLTRKKSNAQPEQIIIPLRSARIAAKNSASSINENKPTSTSSLGRRDKWHNSNIGFNNLNPNVLSPTNLKLKKCVIRVKRIRLHEQDNNTSCPFQTRKMIVRLKKTTISTDNIRKLTTLIGNVQLTEPNQSIDKSENSVEQSNDFIIKQCRVRLRRTPFPFEQNTIDESHAKKHSSDTGSEKSGDQVLHTTIGNEMSRFEPIRNSTVLNYTYHREIENAGLQAEKSDETLSKTKSSREVLKHPEEIESMLLSCDVNENLEEDLNFNKIPIQTHKFFKEPVQEREIRTKTRLQQLTKSKEDNASDAAGKDIYAFPLSQEESKSPSKLIDPTADVVKKLIKQGKVNVATLNKGRGKPRVTFKRQPRMAKAKRKVLKPKVIDQQTTFSNLARAVLVQEANKTTHDDQNEVQTTDNRYMSTPLTQKTKPIQGTHLSPIPQMASPWRPYQSGSNKSFSFVRNSQNLPSFSSDVFNNSQPSKSQRNDISPEKVLSEISNQLNTVENESVSPPQSPISSHDSNEENIPPMSEQENFSGPDKTNSNIFNLRQVPNPLQSLPSAQRRPLSQINILEVITLPSWRKLSPEKANANVEANNAQIPKDKSSEEGLFGFEEFIENDESHNTAQENVEMVEDEELLHARLKSLKRFRPKENEIRKTERNAKYRLFEDDSNPLKQRNIKEMLCSTMVNNNPKNVQVAQERGEVEVGGADGVEDLTPLVLFGDPEPETTIDEKSIRHTYIRPKRKKKQRHNFVMFPEESDEHSSDDDEHNRSIGHNRKRTKKAADQFNEELTSFVSEFNDMCKEVEDYELIVE